MRNVTGFDNLVDSANNSSGELELIKTQRYDNKTVDCLECEEEIAPARRRALPGVQHCLDCQRELETSRDSQVRVKAV